MEVPTRSRPSPMVESAWYLLKCVFFLSALPWPTALKCGCSGDSAPRSGSGVHQTAREHPFPVEAGDRRLQLDR